MEPLLTRIMTIELQWHARLLLCELRVKPQFKTLAA